LILLALGLSGKRLQGVPREPGMNTFLIALAVAIVLLLAARVALRHYFPPDT